ncbi:hypothetical protein LIER_08373 [Lithospermum erythrorhizon]|uniref:Uncharacterized protein n=1 Tax=Lithospermum erythrorhizon TaxID=34254 RepID=A0AAV3PBS7_LITER
MSPSFRSPVGGVALSRLFLYFQPFSPFLIILSKLPLPLAKIITYSLGLDQTRFLIIYGTKSGFLCEAVWQSGSLIWSLQDEAKCLPICTTADIDAVAKIHLILPQGNDKLTWHIFCEESMLVKAGLVFDKEFGPKNSGEPPSWGSSSATPHANIIPRVSIPPMLKRLAMEAPTSSSRPSK